MLRPCFEDVWSGNTGKFREILIEDGIIPIAIFEPYLENAEDHREGEFLLFADTGEVCDERNSGIYYAPVEMDSFANFSQSRKISEDDITLYPYFMSLIAQFMDIHYDPSDT